MHSLQLKLASSSSHHNLSFHTESGLLVSLLDKSTLSFSQDDQVHIHINCEKPIAKSAITCLPDKTIVICACEPAQFFAWTIDTYLQQAISLPVQIDSPQELPTSSSQNSLSIKDNFLMSMWSEYFCIYVPELSVVYLWKASTDSHLRFQLLNTFTVFGAVYSLLLTGSHLILGKAGSVHVFNWRYVERLRSKGEKATIDKALGRVEYLPKSTSHEKVIEMKMYTHSKIFCRTSAGSLFALHCLIPYEKDALVRLVSPTLQNSFVTALDVCSAQLEPLISSNQGMAAFVCGSKQAVLFTKAKLIFEYLQQVKGLDSVEIPIVRTVLHPRQVQSAVFLTPDTCLIQDEKGVTLLHSWQETS